MNYLCTVEADAPVVIVAVKQSGRGDMDDFVFQLSSRFKVAQEEENRGFDGLIGEVIVWSEELTPGQAQSVFQYLQGKWLQGGAPDKHQSKLALSRHEKKLKAEQLTPTSPVACLVEVCDFWNSDLKQYTFHTGNPWRDEHLYGSQFYALSSNLPGTIPVYDFWNKTLRKLTFHTEPAAPQEEKKGLQFYVYKTQANRHES